MRLGLHLKLTFAEGPLCVHQGGGLMDADCRLHHTDHPITHNATNDQSHLHLLLYMQAAHGYFRTCPLSAGPQPSSTLAIANCWT